MTVSSMPCGNVIFKPKMKAEKTIIQTIHDPLTGIDFTIKMDLIEPTPFENLMYSYIISPRPVYLNYVDKAAKFSARCRVLRRRLNRAWGRK